MYTYLSYHRIIEISTLCLSMKRFSDGILFFPSFLYQWIIFAIFLIINWLVFQLKIMLSERTCLGCVNRSLDLFELKRFFRR